MNTQTVFLLSLKNWTVWNNVEVLYLLSQRSVIKCYYCHLIGYFEVFPKIWSILYILRNEISFQLYTHLIFFSKVLVLRKLCYACLFCLCISIKPKNFTFQNSLSLIFLPPSLLHFLLLRKFTYQGDLLLVPYFCIKVNSKNGNSAVSIKHLTVCAISTSMMS